MTDDFTPGETAIYTNEENLHCGETVRIIRKLSDRNDYYKVRFSHGTFTIHEDHLKRVLPDPEVLPEGSE